MKRSVLQLWSQKGGEGSYTTGEAICASRSVHAHVGGISCPVAQAGAREVGHGVATAHMADHCMGDV